MQSGLKILSIFRSSAVWHVIFILVILYNVSTINVLVLAIGILPFLQGAFLNTTVLVYFAEISFAIAAFLSIYHISTIFRRRKRRQDKAVIHGSMSVKEAWGRSRFLTKLLCIIIFVYFLCSLYVLFWGLGFTGKIPFMEVDVKWIVYSIISFALATLIAGFHLATLIFRQKRAVDHLVFSQRANG